MIPLSLYIHIPWCEKKCPYCDFNSHMATDKIGEPAYVAALMKDLLHDVNHYSDSIKNRKLQSIFIGGGTPSLFSAHSIAAIIDGVAEQIEFEQDIEITLEANPGSAEVDKFVGFRQAGVNRLSIGVQSFNASHLKSLGRVHSDTEALNAVEHAKSAGFAKLNLDLMFGLPKQTIEQCISDVEQAIKLQPSHLSCYQLTIEPNTMFHHNPPITPDDETLWQMQLAIQSCSSMADYNQYEVSAYAQSKQQCRHNLNYWQFADYLGIGAGAHGKLTTANGDVWRNWKIKHPASYLKRANANDQVYGANKKVDAHQLPFEFMLNTLRLTDGFDIALFEQRTSQLINNIDEPLNKHQEQGLITISDKFIKLTERGTMMVNEMLQDYLPD